jgi:hypothetical protein
MSLILGILDSGGAAAGAGGSYESIATVTVGSGGSANVEFTSIPATYTHLQIRGIGQSSRTGTNRSDLLVKFNGSSTGYAYHYLQGNGSAAAAVGASSQTYGTVVSNAIPAQDYTSQFGAVVIDILDYANTNKNTTLRGLGGTDNNGAGTIALGSTLWNNTAAITSVELTIDGAYSFKQYSQFALYGIKGS